MDPPEDNKKTKSQSGEKVTKKAEEKTNPIAISTKTKSKSVEKTIKKPVEKEKQVATPTKVNSQSVEKPKSKPKINQEEAPKKVTKAKTLIKEVEKCDEGEEEPKAKVASKKPKSI